MEGDVHPGEYISIKNDAEEVQLFSPQLKTVSSLTGNPENVPSSTKKYLRAVKVGPLLLIK